jgi:Ca-activated chloride channel family protein
MFSFVQTFWLMAGLLACCGAVVFITFSTARRRKKLAQFAAPHLLPQLTANVSQTRRRLKNILFVLGLACLFLALARPQWGSRLVDVRRKGIDILIGFDVSKSMLAQDVKPNRLQRVKLAVRDFAARLSGDRIGLLPFAGTSFLRYPLTTDYDAFNASLDDLDIDIILKGGTNIGAAIQDAAKILSSESNYKILILITDGEDLSQDALKAAALAKKEKMIIYTVGVGTLQGELIPLPGGGAGNFVKDERGEFVTSKLDEKTLTAIAETTGGIYVPLGNMGQGLDTIYERKLALIPKEDQAQRKKKVPVERFQWPLSVAIVLFSLEFLLIGRRRALHLPFITTAGRRKKQQAAAMLLLCVLCSGSARADEGGNLFQAGKYKEAAELYQNRLEQDSGNPALHFNLGVALHKQRNYEKAAAEFSRALQTEDLVLQAKSYYNRGVSQYAAGTEIAEKAGSNIEQAVEQLKQAKQSFEAALKLKSENKKANHNLQAVEKKLAELEEKQKQQQKQKPQDGENRQKQEHNSQKNDKNQQKGQKEEKQQSGADNKQDNSSGQKQQEQQIGQQRQNPQAKNDTKKGEGKEQSGDREKQQQNAVPEPSKEQKKAEDTAATPQKQVGSADQTDKPSQEQKEGTNMMMGKMTEEEARSLLDSLKGEQGELNFMPQEAADGEPVGRDW